MVTATVRNMPEATATSNGPKLTPWETDKTTANHKSNE